MRTYIECIKYSWILEGLVPPHILLYSRLERDGIQIDCSRDFIRVFLKVLLQHGCHILSSRQLLLTSFVWNSVFCATP
jgi:hypothetical protein